MSDGPDTRYVRAILRGRAQDDVAAGRRIIPVFARDFLWLLDRVDELEGERDAGETAPRLQPERPS
jgi:hypothetical protein